MTLPLVDPNVEPGLGEQLGDGVLRRVFRGIQQNFDALAALFPLAANSMNFQQLPQARVYRATNTAAIATGVWTAVGFDAEDYDLGTTDGMHDAVNVNRLTCRVAGLYVLHANICWDAAAGGSRGARFRLNGAGGPWAEEEIPANVAANFTQLNISTEMRLAVNDYVEVEAQQTSGGGLVIIASGAASATNFCASWRSP